MKLKNSFQYIWDNNWVLFILALFSIMVFKFVENGGRLFGITLICYLLYRLIIFWTTAIAITTQGIILQKVFTRKTMDWSEVEQVLLAHNGNICLQSNGVTIDIEKFEHSETVLQEIKQNTGITPLKYVDIHTKNLTLRLLIYTAIFVLGIVLWFLLLHRTDLLWFTLFGLLVGVKDICVLGRFPLDAEKFNKVQYRLRFITNTMSVVFILYYEDVKASAMAMLLFFIITSASIKVAKLWLTKFTKGVLIHRLNSLGIVVQE